jgi:SAM-dependent methyltransferase
MKDFLFLTREIWEGKSLLRATLNARLQQEFLEGKILDLGSGGSDRYSTTIPRHISSSYELFDVKQGVVVDFEQDRLPYTDSAYDTILLFNVLEHLFNYSNILKEIRRIKRTDGVFIGYVPFLHWYHADPHDYFRYTHEALERILRDIGFEDIVIEKIYRGPYTTAFQIIHPTLPRIIRTLVFAPAYLFDVIFRAIRPKGGERYVLGYYFKTK